VSTLFLATTRVIGRGWLLRLQKVDHHGQAVHLQGHFLGLQDGDRVQVPDSDQIRCGIIVGNSMDSNETTGLIQTVTLADILLVVGVPDKLLSETRYKSVDYHGPALITNVYYE